MNDRSLAFSRTARSRGALLRAGLSRAGAPGAALPAPRRRSIAVLAGILAAATAMSCAALAIPAQSASGAAVASAAAGTSSVTVASGISLASDTAVASSTSVGSGTEWTAGPADAEGPDGRISLRHTIDPGASTTDHLAITNLGADDTEFIVAAGDGIIGADGAFDIASGEPTDSGSWISIADLGDDGRLMLAGGETRVLPLTIAVPATATPGDHPAGVVVGVSSESGGVAVSHRIGVRLHLQVAGELNPVLATPDLDVSFTPSWIPFAPGELTIRTTIANEGNVRVGAVAGATAEAPAGLAAQEATTTSRELLPGDSVRETITMQVWPLALASGEITVTATAIGDDRIPLPPTIVESFSTMTVSWTGLALIALLLATVTAWLVVRRRRSRPTSGSGSESESESEPTSGSESGSESVPSPV